MRFAEWRSNSLEFHNRAIDVQQRKEKSHEWDWKEQLVNATLLLHLDGQKLSDLEWQHWLQMWAALAKQIHSQHPGLASYVVSIPKIRNA